MPTWANLVDAPFTKQTDGELVCVVADTAAFSDRSLRISPCHLGADFAP